MTELSTLLAKAQAEMSNAEMNKINPHFKSKYADLAAIRDAVIPALTKHGLSVTQTTDFREELLILRTTLRGPNGEVIESVYPLPIGKPQEMGSALTYARRYTLAALCGIASEEDDDGNEAQKAETPTSKSETMTAEDWKEWHDQFRIDLSNCATLTDLDQLENLHADKLQRLGRQRNKEAFERVTMAIVERRGELAQALDPAKQGPIDDEIPY